MGKPKYLEAPFWRYSAGYVLPRTYRPGTRQEFRRRCRLRRASRSVNWLHSSPPIVTVATARALWRRAALLVRQAQSILNNMDVEC